jgi:DmsE family decaheme c-type cytochrome
LAIAGDPSYDEARASQPYAEGGEKTCLTCHNSHPVDFILQRPHAMEGDPRTPFGGGHACETCHGPSGDHAQSKIVDDKLILPPMLFKKPQIEGFAASPVEAQNQVCLGCHQSGARVNWQGSHHQVNNLACTTCHTVHTAEDPVLAKITQPGVCFTCHAQQRAESAMYSHHPIREGKVACSDCHNPHGSPGPHQLKEFSINETCYNCHGEKRGPLLFEHQPVREDCTNCHTVHGSSQPRLLAEPLNFLCGSCHSSEANSSGGSFGGAHSIAARSPTGTTFFNSSLANQRQCLNCHSQVHGSNSPSGAFFFR